MVFVPVQKLSGIVYTPIRYVTLRFRDLSFAPLSLRYRNRAEITVVMCEQKPHLVWFSRRRKSYPVLFEHSLTSRAGACQIFSVLRWHLIFFSRSKTWTVSFCPSYLIKEFVGRTSSVFIANTWYFKWWLFYLCRYGLGLYQQDQVERLLMLVSTVLR